MDPDLPAKSHVIVCLNTDWFIVILLSADWLTGDDVIIVLSSDWPTGHVIMVHLADWLQCVTVLRYLSRS